MPYAPGYDRLRVPGDDGNHFEGIPKRLVEVVKGEPHVAWPFLRLNAATIDSFTKYRGFSVLVVGGVEVNGVDSISTLDWVVLTLLSQHSCCGLGENLALRSASLSRGANSSYLIKVLIGGCEVGRGVWLDNDDANAHLWSIILHRELLFLEG